MPLLDHFHAPVDGELPWDTLHSSWASDIARLLNLRWLKHPFRALERTLIGPRAEVDDGKGPAATSAVPLVLSDTIEVRVYSGRAGWDLVGAIELISPSNKDRPEVRRAFVNKCASYLQSGVNVVLIDVVTDRRANLHNELLDMLANTGPAHFGDDIRLYAASYRPVQRGDRSELDIWMEPCKVGAELPTMPLRLTGDLFVPIEFETSYLETCRSHWL